MRMYFILMPIAVLIWFVGIEIGIKMIELAPMGIHDYYFYYPKIEELEGFSVSPWKTDPAVGEGKMVYRDCVYD